MKPRIALVAAVFNGRVVAPMLAAARDEIQQQCVLAQTVEVSGSYELPLIVDALLQRSDVDAVVVLGYIERGETLHGEVMGHAIHRSFIESQLAHRKPVGLGVIGPGATEKQALQRNETYARTAVRAALTSCQVLQRIVDE